MSDEIKDSAADAEVRKIVKKEMSKQMGDVWAVLKRIKKAAELHWGVDIDNDGKIGSTRIAASLWVFALLTVTVLATTPIVSWYDSDAVKGTAKIDSDDAGAATLTVDKVVASSGITAPISATTITASGAITGQSTLTLTNGTATIKAAVINTTLGVTGTISNAALTASQLVLTDANKVLTSSATVPADSVNKAAMSAVDYGDFTAGSGGDCTLDASVVAAATLADAVQDMVVNSFTAVAVPNANGGTNVVTVTAKDMGGNTLSGRSMFTCFLSLTEFGAPSADCVSEGDFVVSNGVEVEQRVDKAVYDVMTGSNGVVTLTINDTPGVTNYLHTVSGGGIVTAIPLIYAIP